MKLSKAKAEHIVCCHGNPCDWLATQKDGSIYVICTYPPPASTWSPQEWLPLALRKLSTAGHALIGVQATPLELAAYAEVLAACSSFEIGSALPGPAFSDPEETGWRMILHIVGQPTRRRLMPAPVLWSQMYSHDPGAFSEALVLHARIVGEPIVDLFAHEWPYIAEEAANNGIRTLAIS